MADWATRRSPRRATQRALGHRQRAAGLGRVSFRAGQVDHQIACVRMRLCPTPRSSTPLAASQSNPSLPARAKRNPAERDFAASGVNGAAASRYDVAEPDRRAGYAREPRHHRPEPGLRGYPTGRQWREKRARMRRFIERPPRRNAGGQKAPSQKQATQHHCTRKDQSFGETQRTRTTGPRARLGQQCPIKRHLDPCPGCQAIGPIGF